MEKIALKDVFSVPKNQPILCVIQPVINSPDKVTLVKWVKENNECDFSEYITLDIDMIDCTKPTNYCCNINGKEYAVVEVIFKPEAAITLIELLDLIAENKGHGKFKTMQDILKALAYS